MAYEQHEIAPVYDAHARILILGSFPSVKSRESHFFLRAPAESFLACAGCGDRTERTHRHT